jgi:hypothetical protein
MTERHLHIAEPFVPEPLSISDEQVRELVAVKDTLGVLGADIDYRPVALNAAHIGCVEEAAAELRRQGFLLLPSMLDRVAARWHEASGSGRETTRIDSPSSALPAPETSCTCGGSGVCITCTLASFEDGAA